MEINDQLIDKLSDLSRLKFEGEDKSAIKTDLKKMIDFIEKLNQLDTTDVQPLIYMTDEPLILRKDVVGPELTQEEALLNAPSKDSDYFKVPKVLDK
jgi:aspartyl-tRNA(Asn)/glutamyl-tRNA(Gln) amidotransferase subunit C